MMQHYGIIEYNVVSGESTESTMSEGMVFNGFYISYNWSTQGYGCRTTALVLGQMEKFYILKGDHRDQYKHLVNQGFHACYEYYKDNIGDAHEYSDDLIDL